MSSTLVAREIDHVEMSTSSYDFRRKRNLRIIVGSLWVLVCVIVGLSLAYWFTRTKSLEEINQNHPSLGGPYKRAAVASDAGPCSNVGTVILQRNGSAVDSAIATILCVGVINMHSTGIGGGGFMLVYNRSKASAEVFDFRETAPAKAKEDMFKNASFKEINSTLATGVPGEVRGYYAAWKAYGRLPWKELVQPAIDKAKYGFLINPALYKTMLKEKDSLKKDPGLREILTDKDGNLKNLGDNITNLQYANTLEKIRDDPESFYKGSLAEEIVQDIQRRGGIITLRDLQDYKVIRKKALVNQLGDITWYTVPPPSSGPVITLILNILKGGFGYFICTSVLHGRPFWEWPNVMICLML